MRGSGRCRRRAVERRTAGWRRGGSRRGSSSSRSGRGANQPSPARCLAKASRARSDRGHGRRDTLSAELPRAGAGARRRCASPCAPGAPEPAAVVSPPESGGRLTGRPWSSRPAEDVMEGVRAEPGPPSRGRDSPRASRRAASHARPSSMTFRPRQVDRHGARRSHASSQAHVHRSTSRPPASIQPT
jgi:hypothetical protein